MIDEFGNQFSISDVVARINDKLAQVVWWYVVRGVNSNEVFGVFSNPVEASAAIVKYKEYDKKNERGPKITYEIVVNRGNPYGLKKEDAT